MTGRKGIDGRRAVAAGIAAMMVAGFVLGGCSASGVGPKAEINEETKFAQKDFGKSSPRVTVSKKVPKGGGRYQVGKPYKVRGKWYKPKEDPTYIASGMASWYGPNFHGRLTANGEIYDQYALSAAHPTLPLPSYVRVTNAENGRSVIVRVNDRGPFAHNRVIDLSSRAADMLDYKSKGVAKVKIEYVGKARMDGKDERFLMASYRAPGFDSIVPGATRPGTMLAMNDAPRRDSLERAVDKQATSSVVIAAATVIPVPSPSPGLLADGIPMNLSEPVIRLASLRPLGYSAEPPRDTFAIRVAAAFDLLESNRIRNAGTGGDNLAAETAILSLGAFDDPEAMEQARARVESIGIISAQAIQTDQGERFELRLHVGGDVAGPVLMTLHALGFEDARRVLQ